MPLDGFTLHFLTEELRRDIVGCRVEKVHQPSKDELVMHLRDRNGAKKLFLSASANSPRVHLTSRAPENPAVPPHPAHKHPARQPRPAADVLHAHAKASDERTDNRCAPERA